MIRSHPSAFVPRRRDTNVALIKAVVHARSEAEFVAARAALSRSLHPSLLAELDWMESNVPPGSRAGAMQHVDGLYAENLPALLAARVDELDLTVAEVQQNRDFYAQVVEDAELAEALGEDRLAVVATALAQAPVPLEARHDLALERALALVVDVHHLPVVAQVAVHNAVLFHLDHLPSRLRTKHVLREHLDSALPRLPWSEPVDAAVIDGFREAVAHLDALAVRFGLQRLHDVTRTLQSFLADVDVSTLTGFGGEVHAGLGPCGRCAMLFASAALLSLDPTSPLTCELDDDLLFVPEFNVVRCPFCGHRARVDAPALFHAPSRSQVIYNVPTQGQSKAEAIQRYRPVIEDLRERYRARLDLAAAARFDAAAEVVTHDMSAFLLAIQLGHTAVERHAWNVIRLADGSGLVSDPTKRVILAITADELRDAWGQARPVASMPAPPAEPDLATAGEAGPASAAAGRRAFDEGRLEEARAIFERILERDPADTMARHNLATAFLALGDKGRAKAVLTG